MNRAALLVLSLTLAFSAGCVAAAAAAAGTIGFVEYDRNQAHRDFDHDFEKVWTAATGATSALGYQPLVIKDRTPVEGHFEAGEDLWASVETHPEGYVCVAVRIGTFDTDDHRRRAGLFLNEVAERLGEEPNRVEEHGDVH